MSRTYKDRLWIGHKSQKANPLGVCRCSQCSVVKRKRRGGKKTTDVHFMKKTNRKAWKNNDGVDIRKGYYYG